METIQTASETKKELDFKLHRKLRCSAPCVTGFKRSLIENKYLARSHLSRLRKLWFRGKKNGVLGKLLG